MPFDVLNLIAGMFIDIFGSGLAVAFIVVSWVLLLLVFARVSRVVILMLITPLMIILSTYGISSFIGITSTWKWIPLALLIVMGILFSMIFWLITR